MEKKIIDWCGVGDVARKLSKTKLEVRLEGLTYGRNNRRLY